ASQPPSRTGALAAVQTGDAAATPAGEAETVTFALPGDRVFPEGVACDPATGNFFVGSTEDGAVYRGNIGSGGAEAEVFLPAGGDGREAVTGLKVDDQGRLFVAGRMTGRVFVYDAVSGDLIQAFETPPTENTLINDIAMTEDAAYVTDSFRPVLFRIPLDAAGVGELEEWLDLDGTPIAYGDGFNLNGIAATPDGRSLLTVHYDRGELFRIDIEDQSVTQVDLGGASLETADGILLDGETLYVVLGGPGEIVPVTLSEDLTTGEVGEPFADPSFRNPTTLAACGDGRLLVVNSQLDMAGEGGAPELPFTVSSIAIP
ncbi:MAG: superoxide dismutase, partial [Chloroflexia bacterium]|nr:superoxide dismutase [Chloroflexia bacterium]